MNRGYRVKLFRILKNITFTILILGIVIGIYVTFIERKLLVVKKIDSNVLKEEVGLKLVQFTDTQLGEYYTIDDLKRAVDKINSVNPDIVVFTGDLIDHANKYEDINKVSGVLKKINANVGKYAIFGNHDYGGGAEWYYENIMEEAGFDVLRNEKVSLTYNDKLINIIGADDGLMRKLNAQNCINGVSEDAINILLLHEPDLIQEFYNYPIDLALCGHSHGGQVYIPFYGPLVNNYLAKNYSKGLYYLDNDRETVLYVDSGLGNTKVPFRMCNIPRVTLFNI